MTVYRIVILFISLCSCLCSDEIDYDIAIVGTSPICMVEALYHAALGERVLLIEANEKCGGAWKSLSICGIEDVDLGCHQVGNNREILDFWQRYIGCSFVCLDHPNQKAEGEHLNCPSGYYFAHGCHGVITTLQERLRELENIHLYHARLESIRFLLKQKLVELHFPAGVVTSRKLKATQGSCFQVLNFPADFFIPSYQCFNHLYLLVEEEDPIRFTFLGSVVSGVVRTMNLTPFLHSIEKNNQLIVVQINSSLHSEEPESVLEKLKQVNYLSERARLLCYETYSYPQAYMELEFVKKLGGEMFEVIEANLFWEMTCYLDKWKKAIHPRTLEF